jgi:hypothetical protein
MYNYGEYTKMLTFYITIVILVVELQLLSF